MPGTATTSSVTVAVVCICSAVHLRRCLAALRAQEAAPAFDVLVAADPHVAGLDAVAADHPEIRLVSNAGQRTPLELASCAMRASPGDVILLTEDHCVPSPRWVATMVAARVPGRAVVGGRVEIRAGANATDWAFYFVDFFRYANPVTAGPAPTLTVCNAAYGRAEVDRIAELWREQFHETAINDALRQFGDLWLEPASVVTMARHVSLRDAVYERYAFGRLFGCTRNRFVARGRRLFYAAFAPTLPALLLGRMASKALRSSALRRSFARAILPLTAMVVAWSLGEWLGYLTGRLPRSLVVAPELRAAARGRCANAADPPQ